MKKLIDLQAFTRVVNLFLMLALICTMLTALMMGITVVGPEKFFNVFSGTQPQTKQNTHSADDPVWQPPGLLNVPDNEESAQIRYGRNLVVHTARYLGPQGTVKPLSNGMNCQNCHLEAGTKPFGNNFSAVASTYPKFRARSGTIESIEKRVNDCFERSLNGQPLEEESKEMKAIVAYIKWLGKSVPQGTVPKGAGLIELTYLDIPADTAKGKVLYGLKCSSCHGINGEGLRNADATEWTYPPLWGNNSYNTGAGLYRLSRFAGYIKANMPLGASYAEPQLTDEEAWHIAAYVNSMPRPKMDITHDWPDISQKPVDYPFGPYADGFSEVQHKYGPFKPILQKRKALSGN